MVLKQYNNIISILWNKLLNSNKYTSNISGKFMMCYVS